MPYSTRELARPTKVLQAFQLAAAAVFLAQATPFAAAQGQLWATQPGTGLDDEATAAASDGAGGVYVCGSTLGSLGAANAGSADAWLARYDAAGNKTWMRQLGGSLYDGAFAVTGNGAGGVFVCGTTENSLGGASAGSTDAWLARYDGAGNQEWIVQLGTSWAERALSAAPDGQGGAYLGGGTQGNLAAINGLPGTFDAWLAHYDGQGNPTWIRQFGSTLEDVTQGSASDGAGGVYVCGRTDLNLAGASAGSADAWVARYDIAGTRLWVKQFGTNKADFAFAAARDGTGGVYLGGVTEGSLGGPNAGFGDAWLARIDGAGSTLWTRQFGTFFADSAQALAPDGSGGVFLTGVTGGSLGGPSAGFDDVWLANYDGAGNELDLVQLGTGDYDVALAAAPDGAGGVFVGGNTKGTLGGPHAGGTDAWLMRFGECGSSSSYCSASSTSIAGCMAAIGSSGSPSLGNLAGFTIASGNVPGGNVGICIFGDHGPASTPFGTLGGLICVQGPIFRTGPKPGGGSTGQCNGAYGFTLLDLFFAGPILTPGSTLNAQIWARDPANPDGFLLSDGLEIVLCP